MTRNSIPERRRLFWRQIGRGVYVLIDQDNGRTVGRVIASEIGWTATVFGNEATVHETQSAAERWCMERST